MQKITREPDIRTQRGPWVFKFFAAAGTLLALFVLLTPCLMRAQLATADILGTVTDSTGAVVPDAKVTIRNTGTGIASSANSDKVGEFLFSHVQIGTFKMTVDAKGFKNFTVNNLELTAGQRVRVNARLEIGSQVETVQVEATAEEELQTDSSDINSQISANQVSEMPTNGRNYYNLIGFEAGMGSGGGGGDPTDSRQSMSFTANGQGSTYNNNMIDGMDNNERTLGTVAVEPSLDALQEVQVEASNYSAEYSRTGGGIANLITKGGTNQFHGTAFEFMRNDAFDSYSWEPSGTAKTKTELRQNQFGGSLGGPILKNKAFFFGDYQGWRLIDGGLKTALVPTEAEYESIHDYSKGAATSITFNDQWDAWGGQDLTIGAGDISPLGLAWLMEAPKPLTSCSSTSSGLCGKNAYNWYMAANTVQNADTYDGRVDYHFNDKNTLFGRFSHNKTITTTPGGYPATTIVNGNSKTYGNVSVNTVIDTNLALDYVHVFSPATLFEAKASYLRPNQVAATDGIGVWTMADLGYSCGAAYCYNTPGVYTFPGPNLTSTYRGSTYANASSAATNYAFNGGGGLKGYIENTFQYNAALTLNRKSHSIKMGVALIRRQVYAPANSGGGGYFSAEYTGNMLGDLLEGKSVSVSVSDTMIKPRRLMWEPSAYIQDDWRATKSLTLNIGVRYDIYTPSTDRYGNFSNFNPSTDLIVSPNLLGNNSSSRTGNIVTDMRDVSPRVGFAYSLSNDNIITRNMVLRGGFGISYFPGNTGTTPGDFEFEMLNTPFIWSMGCGNPHYTTSAACSSSNGYMTVDQYNAEPYGMADGGYSFKYGMPRASYDSTLATDTSLYTSSTAMDLFINPNFRPGYLEQFNLQLQKQVGNNIVTAGFVGNLGRRIPTLQNINQPTSVDYVNYPLYSSSTDWMNNVTVQQVMSAANSAWEAGEATYERRLAQGFSANVNFTWARTESQGTGTSECVLYGCPMDNGSGTAVPVNGWKQYNYDGSTSHRAAGMLSYNIPFGNSLHGVAGATLKGWALNGTGSWNTGAWGQVTMSIDQSGLKALSQAAGSSGGTEYPNLVKGISPKPKHQSLENWVNPLAYQLQAADMLGNGNKSTVLEPRSRDADAGLGKTFSLLEGFKLQFRAEAFNITNTPNYSTSGAGGGPPGSASGTLAISQFDSNGNPVLSTTGFGAISNGSGSRIFQFGLKLLY
jgi:hypothetical protein